MANERIYTKDPLPAYEELRDFIGNTAVGLFDELMAFIQRHYDFEREIIFGGKNYGVMVRFRKSGKTLVSIFPEKGGYSAVLVYGKKEIAQFEERQSEFSFDMVHLFRNTKQYHDGKWLLIRVEDEERLAELKKMIIVKKKTKKLELP